MLICRTAAGFKPPLLPAPDLNRGVDPGDDANVSQCIGLRHGWKMENAGPGAAMRRPDALARLMRKRGRWVKRRDAMGGME